jgi:hypothetical protein
MRKKLVGKSCPAKVKSYHKEVESCHAEGMKELLYGRKEGAAMW